MDWKQSWIWRLARWYFSLDLLPLDILSEWLNQNSIQKHLNRSWLRESIHWLNNLRDDNKSPVVAHNKLPSELLDHNHPISVRSCGHCCCCCYCPWPGNGLIIQSSRSASLFTDYMDHRTDHDHDQLHLHQSSYYTLDGQQVASERCNRWRMDGLPKFGSQHPYVLAVAAIQPWESRILFVRGCCCCGCSPGETLRVISVPTWIRINGQLRLLYSLYSFA